VKARDKYASPFLQNTEEIGQNRLLLGAGAAEPGGGGMCPPPTFLKVKKVPFFLGCLRTKKVFLE
jgi:hypothetical protein